MVSKVENLIELFKDSIDSSTDYSLKDLTKILEDKYKDVYGGGKKKVSSGNAEKKAPSAYNLFIKNEIAKIRDENPEGVAPRDYMKMAAGRWKEQKDNLTTSNE